jgi:hypothetical protein
MQFAMSNNCNITIIVIMMTIMFIYDNGNDYKFIDLFIIYQLIY